MDGVLNINKPSGITSHDVVAKVRHLTKVKKVGHTGTLDPMAAGVLPLCIGQATRIARFLTSDIKRYRAVAKLGIETDTLDKEGQILRQTPASHIKAEDIEQILAEFRGSIKQIPPMFSALKKDGQRLYKLARQGIVVDRPPRQAQIHSLKVCDFSPPYFTLEIECSAGTYVRSLVADIGQKLGSGATLWELLRTLSGKFRLEDSYTIEQITKLVISGKLSSAIINVNQALNHIPSVTVNEAAVKLIQNGVSLKGTSIQGFPNHPQTTPSRIIPKGDLLRLISPSNQLLALAETLQPFNFTGTINSEECILHPKLVFCIPLL